MKNLVAFMVGLLLIFIVSLLGVATADPLVPFVGQLEGDVVKLCIKPVQTEEGKWMTHCVLIPFDMILGKSIECPIKGDYLNCGLKK